MTVSAPAFADSGVRVADGGAKGKIVLATRAFAPGEVIFAEEAFVFAPWSFDVCSKCEERKSDAIAGTFCACERKGAAEVKPLYPGTLATDLARREQVVRLMTGIEGIDEVDRARCVLRCLAMVERNSGALAAVLQLTSANYERSLKAATQLRGQAPDAFPANVSDAQLATLIGVLNTNSHELENLGGSGLFLSACRMEHNCSPNCSFTTYNSQLWMTAIKPIAVGDALSIDYGNFFYRPTEERMSSLLESYGFLCSCDACVANADVTRSFQCQKSGCQKTHRGVVWPYPKKSAAPLVSPADLDFDWKCGSCNEVATKQEVARFLAAEKDLLENGFPESLEEVDAVVSQGVVHERHYLLFWALDAIGCEAAALIAFLDDEEHHASLTQTWERIIAYMNEVVPSAHHEKTIYYDNLAQVRVVLGDLAGAKQAYARAYEMACAVSGAHCVPTQKLRKLMESPPQTGAELRRIYEADAKPTRPFKDDDDDDGDEDFDDEDGESGQ
ncbi:hypothetical protein PybrP1_002422 [[Pythium] brassicae (nom. inval.)]|nr:hypothetical protein PybrP1_002422 [[Pythium] brassicae (nom. inval.)]